jgi:hypothetical protein
MVSRRPVLTLLLAALGVVCAAAAQAAVPSAANSLVDPSCLRVCPAGDMNLHVVVRDLANNPVSASTVVVDFSNCSGVLFCTPLPGDPYTLVPPAQIRMVSDAAGIADIPIRAGGVCVGTINIFADGVLLASRAAVSSPDQNGDLTVNAVDSGILAGKLGGSDPTGDFNCSASVESGDTGILLAHLGHSCNAVVPVKPSTWGTIKVIYR